jgi:uncharacterized protein (TIGR03435 family)
MGTPGMIRMGGMPMSQITGMLTNQTGRLVFDKTNLTGNWDFELTYAAEATPGAVPPGAQPPPADPDAPDLFTAVREQLGLKLESTKCPVEVLVVDSVQPLTPD